MIALPIKDHSQDNLALLPSTATSISISSLPTQLKLRNALRTQLLLSPVDTLVKNAMLKTHAFSAKTAQEMFAQVLLKKPSALSTVIVRSVPIALLLPQMELTELMEPMEQTPLALALPKSRQVLLAQMTTCAQTHKDASTVNVLIIIP
jgi:hypothetical protein